MSQTERILDRLRHIAHGWAARPSASDVREFQHTLGELYQTGWDYVLGWENELPDQYLPQRYLERRKDVIHQLELDLGYLSTEWRAGKGGPEREAEILAAYEQAMKELYRIGHWSGEPDIQSQLPDELMPQVYHDYWRRQLQE
ncbi:MAG: hypothetical protein ACRD1T_17580 [Acidimicrobiia bacterium]